MAFSRYRNSRTLSFGTQYGTSRAVAAIRLAVKNGLVPIIDQITLTGNQRLDHIAAKYYQDSRFWWVIAAASEIGWGMQVPPGTVVLVPDLSYISTIIG